MTLTQAANNLARLVEQGCLEAIDEFFATRRNGAMPKLIRLAIQDVDKADSPAEGLVVAAKRIEKLQAALRELEGFAARNVERAKKAAEQGKSNYTRDASPSNWAAFVEASGRLHEANRFALVVRERVREALAP